jgi:hypothetical protein
MIEKTNCYRAISQTHVQPHKQPDKPKRVRRETSQEAAARLSYEAREAGMSYGQYVARKECSMKRYELLQNDTIEYDGKTLYRIRALIDMPEHDVNTGDLGGYIASEDYLKQDGTGWVYPNARALGGAIHGGIICGGTIHGGTICGGIIDGGIICGGTIDGGTIYDGTVYDGEWHTSPLQIRGSRYYFNISDNRDGIYYIQIGCQNHSVDTWRDKWQEIAKNHDANEIVQEYARYFNLAAAMYGFAPVVIDGGAV